MAHSINIGGQLYTDEEYQKLLQTKNIRNVYHKIDIADILYIINVYTKV